MQLIRIVFEFFKIGLYSFGGGYAVIPLIEANVVRKYGWIHLKEFADIITISQITPGPLAVNVSTFVGYKLDGILGAVFATLGSVLPGLLITIFLIKTLIKDLQSDKSQKILNSLSISAFALISIASVNVIQIFNENRSFDGLSIIFIVSASYLAWKEKMNTVTILLIGAVFGLLFY
ncbi:chromate transporter [Erysipelothrix urinaevulpis]|uniref:chromate transporter n=1 Tax=Erysipelothrix urinaevulpis TaxID=2683717 RepID=UPI00135AB45E|nr:chromate transporter [Erysipelothrix urinaevulpis]